MPRIAFDAFSVIVPLGWEDVTDSIEVEGPPDTLAREDGVGAPQFTLALHANGPVPDPSPEVLLEMVVSLADSWGLGAPREVAVESGPLRPAAGSFARDEDSLRVWQAGISPWSPTLACRATKGEN